MTAEQAIRELVRRRVAYYTYVGAGGCAWCSKRVNSGYVPVPGGGHRDGCAIKRLTAAAETGDWATVVAAMAEARP